MHIAYVAGMVDGEGHIGLYRYRAGNRGEDRLRPQLGIASTNRGCLESIRDFIGKGAVYKKSRSGFSPSEVARRKPLYTYHLQGFRAVAGLLRRLLPHLIIKKQLVKDILGECGKPAAMRQKRGVRLSASSTRGLANWCGVAAQSGEAHQSVKLAALGLWRFDSSLPHQLNKIGPSSGVRQARHTWGSLLVPGCEPKVDYTTDGVGRWQDKSATPLAYP